MGLNRTALAASLMAAGILAIAPRAEAQGAPGAPSLIGQYGDWAAYTANSGGQKVCFAIAKPSATKMNPPGRPRDQAYVFVSTRPHERVKNEVSFEFGYPLKANLDANVTIGGANFAMYTQGGGAWIKNAADEPRLLDAMRKGADMTIKGESSRGTETLDTYSLKGISQALDKVAQECP